MCVTSNGMGCVKPRQTHMLKSRWALSAFRSGQQTRTCPLTALKADGLPICFFLTMLMMSNGFAQILTEPYTNFTGKRKTQTIHTQTQKITDKPVPRQLHGFPRPCPSVEMAWLFGLTWWSTSLGGVKILTGEEQMEVCLVAGSKWGCCLFFVALEMWVIKVTLKVQSFEISEVIL